MALFGWHGRPPKNEAVSLPLSLLLLINDGIGRVSLGMREKGGVTGQGVGNENITEISFCGLEHEGHPVE